MNDLVSTRVATLLLVTHMAANNSNRLLVSTRVATLLLVTGA